MDKDNSITLDQPIQQGENSIETITFRKPMAGELRGLSLTEVLQMDVTALQTLIPRISSPTLTKHDVASMDPADLVAAGAVIAGFFIQKAAKAEYPNQ